ncbi:conserved hypothetical protein [Vibrio crassostreae]|uniref:hypothetical protein n=1 Tax=Vibrio crassostreae TaxID=246167 RepID=UPI001B310DB7|nr:hypothetical protein [Vibrio crassostreae]CAK1818308.1 conserved hypothetical protein [Vibrio crassostreae]CAK1818405.1 conserved hypothetical protein [Vibrio crassostreae]CAK1879692.1 conserved hypothetical protein [Vibrio crassostreae]CAK1880056.1 conserved hypothetical protein [Vibrio crassostreae]CAK1894282.1 conserved hypothetical protein [Vibrio crassostreae]
MKQLTLLANEVKRFGVGSDKWLIVREAQEYLYVSSDNGERIRVDAGDTLDIASFKELEITNPHTASIDVVYQLTKRDLKTTPPAQVKFADSMAVSEIRSIVTTRQETAQRFISRDHLVINPNEKKRLFNASVTRLEAIIQNISDTEVEAMVGDNNVSAVVGLPVMGDRQAPAGITITGGGELWAYNNSNTPLKLAMMEVHR